MAFLNPIVQNNWSVGGCFTLKHDPGTSNRGMAILARDLEIDAVAVAVFIGYPCCRVSLSRRPNQSIAKKIRICLREAQSG